MSWYNPKTWFAKSLDLSDKDILNKASSDEINMDEMPPSDPNEPWVFIKGAVPDAEQGVKIELDWNDAFVKFLRDNGIEGASDESVVQKYLAMLHRQMLDKYQEEGGNSFE
jgi:hypothetical protein